MKKLFKKNIDSKLPIYQLTTKKEVLEYYDLTPVDPGDNEYYKVLWKQYLRKLSKIDQPKDVLDAKLVHIRSTILEKEYNEKTGEEITTSAIQYNPLGPNYKNLFFHTFQEMGDLCLLISYQNI